MHAAGPDSTPHTYGICLYLAPIPRTCKGERAAGSIGPSRTAHSAPVGHTYVYGPKGTSTQLLPKNIRTISDTVDGRCITAHGQDAWCSLVSGTEGRLPRLGLRLRLRTRTKSIAQQTLLRTDDHDLMHTRSPAAEDIACSTDRHAIKAMPWHIYIPELLPP